MALPPGLLLNPATGELTGVPTVPGTFVIAMKVRDTLGSQREISETVTISAYTPLAWSGTLGNLMETRAPAGITLAAANGLAPLTWQVYSGTLPTGLSLDAATGAITGTPNTPGGFSALLRVTDALSQHADVLVATTVAANLTLSYGGTLQGTAQVAYSNAAVQAGGTAPFTYSVASGSLPAGLSLDPATGTISGTPSAASSASVTVRVTDTYGFTADAPLTFDIAAFPAISGAPARGMAGKAYSASFTGSGGHPAYSWSMPATNGLSINAATGAVSGTPVAAGTFTLVATLTDALGVSTTLSRSVSFAAALAISGSYAGTIARLASYPAFAPSVAGGWAPYTFAISAGALPTGLSLNAATGAITGSPTVQSVNSATLRVTDADGSTATMAVNITVAGDLSLTGSVPTFATVGVAFTGDTLGSSGGTAPYSWSVASGALPPGVSLNTGTGDLTGTPVAASGQTDPVTYSFTIRVSDANTSYAQSAFSCVVALPPALAGTLPDASNGTPYSASYAASGGHPPLSYAISAGALPTGLSLNTSTGVISGTPSANGASTFTVTVTDAHGNTANRAGTVTVYAAPSLSGSYTSAIEAGIAYSSAGKTASGGKSPLAWAVSGTLPPGLSLNSGNGALSGTPTTPGSYAFTVKVTDALGISASSAVSLTIAAALSVDISAIPTRLEEATNIVAASAVAHGGVAPYSYALGNATMPLGTLGINNSTGLVSGQANNGQYGNYWPQIIVTDALGAQAAQTWNFSVAHQPAMTVYSPPGGTVGVPYGYNFVAANGWTPYTFGLAIGSWPTGLSLNPTTGQLSGTPSAPGTFTPTPMVTDALNVSSNPGAVSITIAAYPTLSLSYGRGEAGFAYSGSVSAANGWTPYRYAVVAGALPPGLSLNTSTGAITGTPTTPGSYGFTIRLTDAKSNSVDRAASVAIATTVAIQGSYPSGKTSTAYSSTLSQSGGYAPGTFALASGSLPTGLSLASNGTLSGTPSAAGTYSFTVRLTDADGHAVTKAMSVVIAAPAAVVASATPNPATSYVVGFGTLTASASSTASATGGTGGYTYSWAFVSAVGDAGAFTVSGQGTATLHVSATASSNANAGQGYSRDEVWRVTARDSTGNTDTYDVTFTLSISSAN